ncbi:hypothetical protein HanRHA438_Chr01g0043931 [Helianthus annuus]|nr:hypothetical protein HanRHA438_Chr01g0043931 [Helianthus annuus]
MVVYILNTEDSVATVVLKFTLLKKFACQYWLVCRLNFTIDLFLQDCNCH